MVPILEVWSKHNAPNTILIINNINNNINEIANETFNIFYMQFGL